MRVADTLHWAMPCAAISSFVLLSVVFGMMVKRPISLSFVTFACIDIY